MMMISVKIWDQEGHDSLCHLNHSIRKEDDAQFKDYLVIDMAGVTAYQCNQLHCTIVMNYYYSFKTQRYNTYTQLTLTLRQQAVWNYRKQDK